MRRWTLVMGAAAAVSLVAAAPRIVSHWRERTLRGAPRPLDVVLVTLDTTRADYLGAYARRPSPTPHLDDLARAGVVFTQAYAHVPLTLPSHASILTGLLPPRHEVRDNASHALGPGPPTLGERFVSAGYRTGAFVSAFVLDRRFGLSRGFGVYEDDVTGGGQDNLNAAIRGEVTVGRALEWLERDDDRPILLWVHLYDPHGPYEPPEPFASKFGNDRYAGEVAYTDAQVGRLLEGVGRRKRPTLVAVVGDHGESLGEHGESTHSYFVYSATQRVPLILSLPGHIPGERRVDAVARTSDLLPTLLDIAGLPPVDGLDGRTLVPLIAGSATEERGPAYVESYVPRVWWGARELKGIRTGPWLFIHAPRPELYRVDVDPGERHNVAAAHPEVLESVRARLQAITDRDRWVPTATAVDSETAERLQALGYAAITVETAVGDLPDAKDHTALIAGAERAAVLVEKGQLAEGLAAYKETLAASPSSVALRASILGLLVRLRHDDEALVLATALGQEVPTSEDFVAVRAAALGRLGREREALAVLEAEEARFPRSSRLPLEKAALLMERGRLPEAEAELREAVRRAPRRLDPRLRLGLLLAQRSADPEAASALQSVVAASPRSGEGRQAARALAAVGLRLLEAGRLSEAKAAYEGALEGGERAEDVYLNLSLAQHRLGNPSRAATVLEEGLRMFPASGMIRHRLARMREGPRA